jgi:hypothetical protein
MNWMNITLTAFFILAMVTSYFSYKKKDLEYNVFVVGVVVFTFLAVISLFA